MKQFLQLILFIPLFSLSQTQIGNNINGERTADQFGHSISLSSDGSTAAISSLQHMNDNGDRSGHVRIYKKNLSNEWEQIGPDIEGEAEGDKFGYSVSLSSNGSIVAIGAIHYDGISDNSGRVRIFKYELDDWIQIGSNIDGVAENDLFGYSVSISSDGSIVAVGAIGHDANGSNSGQVSIYEYVSGDWTRTDLFNGQAARDLSGYSVSLSPDGSTVAIGSPLNDLIANENFGRVLVYRKNISGYWERIGHGIYGQNENDEFGSSVSLSYDGSIIAIGAPYNDHDANNSGNVEIHKYESGDWEQIGSDIYGEAAHDHSGSSVSLSSNGSIVAIGAPNNDLDSSSPNYNSGHVRVYKNISNNWKQIGLDIDGEAANNEFGHSLSLSSDGSSIAIGSINNDNPNGNRSGYVRIYDLNTVLSSDSFVLSRFRISPNPATFQATIKLNKGLILEKISIYNSIGQFIQTTTKEVIDTSGLSTGLYYVQIVTDKGKATKKLMIK